MKWVLALGRGPASNARLGHRKWWLATNLPSLALKNLSFNFWLLRSTKQQINSFSHKQLPCHKCEYSCNRLCDKKIQFVWSQVGAEPLCYNYIVLSASNTYLYFLFIYGLPVDRSRWANARGDSKILYMLALWELRVVCSIILIRICNNLLMMRQLRRII